MRGHITHTSSVLDLELSIRARNAMSRANIETVGQLLALAPAEVLLWKNCGSSTVGEICHVLSEHGMYFGMQPGVAMIDRERMARIDATARALLATRMVELQSSIVIRGMYLGEPYTEFLAEDCDAAYRFAAALDSARARFLASQEPPR